MKTYEQVLETVELALAKGEYHYCIEFLLPKINSFPLSSKEGVNLRTILITALCGINKKEEAKRFCKELLKSYDNKTRENAKYLMEVIDSPEIKKPENWNVQFESELSLNKKSLNSLRKKKEVLKKKKFINITETPTGETKPFQKGFSLIIFLILLLLIPLLSGCVKVEDNLDLSELDSITNNLVIESKYIKKFPWQLNFEEKMKDIFPGAEIEQGESTFSLKHKNLNLEDTKQVLKITQRTAGELAGGSTNIEINTIQKNFIFLKKYFYRVNLDLKSIKDFDNLELIFKIITPNKPTLTSKNNSNFEIAKNLIIWNLNQGQINSLEFSFWSLNKLLIGIFTIFIIIIIAYLLRFYRFKLGTDLPQLPSK
ncbi:hypothetical protein EU99_1241 [Prochlorococcus marinus str. MIT 9321]|uniref:DUF3153 domain-containing protein n=1 Tax=Prochlorococcus marinus str. MIT 9401 TaxID=167551 RepID=A0A0A2B3X0_PROMR|nr:DUF3153 domain-containing protein [Prochlorococcus marinus]KGG03655.1 hypothetical protein EU99_1241 [Prochlorococcus marinus str. MIT 9321]KGG04794.1 hypothetical protein EV00_1827 [Prochlorococcus marinus str. MIT 9322]KGG07480.1 hypothetical protein EV01_1818 [Prochlorococcus marinus str. MIT 9401]